MEEYSRRKSGSKSLENHRNLRCTTPSPKRTLQLVLLLWILPLFLAAGGKTEERTDKTNGRFAAGRKRTEKTTPAPQPVSESLIKPCCDAGKFEASASLLIWQAFEDGLELAAINHPLFPASANIPTDISADLLLLDFPWKPAVKLLLGYHFSSPDWDASARWTCFYSKSHRSAKAALSSAGDGLFPLWIPQQAAISSFPTYGSADGNLFLHFNALDLELRFTGGISSSLFLSLHGGLKGLVIQQVFHAHYSDGFSDGIHQMISSNAHVKNRCWGLGPRAGFGSQWRLPQGWSLIAEAAGALALCSMESNRGDRFIGTVSGAPQSGSVHFHEAFWVWRPVLEAKAGVEWALCFGKNRAFSAAFAYEMQHYWEQNMMVRYADEAISYTALNSRGNLTLQGFSLTVSLGY